MMVAIVAGVLGVLGYVGTKYYFKGRHAEINLNLKELQKIQDRREGIDREIAEYPDGKLDAELRRWVR